MGAPRGDITALLAGMRNRDSAAESRLASLVYGELRRIAARYMRRARHAEKRGGDVVKVELDRPDAHPGLVFSPQRSEQILALDEALSRLSVLDERQCKIVEMRFFGGMTDQEIADVLEIAVRTVVR